MFHAKKDKKLLIVLAGSVLLFIFIIVVLTWGNPDPAPVVPQFNPSATPMPPSPIIAPFTQDFPTNYPRDINELLPYTTDSFVIQYPEFDIYTVQIYSSDVELVKQDVAEWFINQGVDPKTVKIRYLSQSDEEVVGAILSLVPYETDTFKIDFSPKMDLFVITLKGSSPEESEQMAYSWLREQGLDDISKINIRIESE